MAKPSSMKNLGKVADEWLAGIGIFTADEVRALGALEVYQRLKRAYPEAITLNALYALEGALLGIDWRSIPEGRRVELRQMAASDLA